MLQITGIIFSILLLNGCISHNNVNKKQNNEPKWLLDPYIDNDTIAAVGCSRKHFDGKEAQKDLAISRALDRIATQKSVLIDNITLRQKEIANGSTNSTSTSSRSLHTVDNVKISTKVKATYTKKDYELCVWMVQR